MKELFLRSRLLLNELLDDDLVSYTQSLERRIRAPDDSVADLNALSVREGTSASLDFTARTKRVIELTRRYRTEIGPLMRLSSEAKLLADSGKLRRAAEALLRMNENMEESGLPKSEASTFCNRVLSSLLYQFRALFLLHVLGLGEENTSLSPAECQKRREASQSTLQLKMQQRSWRKLPENPLFNVTSNTAEEVVAAVDAALSRCRRLSPCIMSNAPMIFPRGVFVEVEESPGINEDEYVLWSSGVLSNGTDISPYIVVNSWSSSSYHNLFSLTKDPRCTAILAYSLLPSLVRLDVIQRFEEKMWEVQDAVEILCISRALQHKALENVSSEVNVVKALAEYRPYHTAQLLFEHGDGYPWDFEVKELHLAATTLFRELGFGEDFLSLWPRTFQFASTAV